MLLIIFYSWCFIGLLPVDGLLAAQKGTETKGAGVKTESPLWEQAEVTAEKLAAAILAVEKKLETLPKETPNNTPEGQQRSVLKERVVLLGEWRERLERVSLLHSELAGMATEGNRLLKEFALLEKRPAPKDPDNPTPEGFLQVQQAFTDSQKAVEAVQAQIKKGRDLISMLPNQRVQAQERLKEAKTEADNYAGMASKESGTKQNLLAMQTGNARLKGRLAEQTLKQLVEEERFANEIVPHRDKQLELARWQNQWAEQAVARYQEALNRHQDTVLKQKEAELAEKSQAAAQAMDPKERFQKSWEAEIARLQKNVADLNKLRTDVLALIATQEKYLKSDKEELKNLQSMVGENGINDRVAEILKNSFHRLESRRNLLTLAIPEEMRVRLEALRPRLFELDAQMAELRERWQTELDQASTSLDETQKSRFKRTAEPLFDTFRELLSEEKQLLMRVDGDERRLGLFPQDRREQLIALETFVLSKIFWIQDAAPLTPATIPQLWNELFSIKQPNSLLNWWLHVLSGETMAQLLQALQEPTFSVVLIGFVLVLPFVLLPAYRNRRLRLVAPLVDTKTDTDQSTELWLSVSLAIGAVPVYLLVAAYMIGMAGLPAAIGTVVQRVLLHIALFLLAWGTNNHFFAQSGLFASHFTTPQAVVNELFRSVRLALLGYLVCLLPWMIFSVAPFHFQVLPRLGYTLFEVATALAVYRLIRPSSALVQHAFGLQKNEDISTSPKIAKVRISFLHRYWLLISRLASLFMVTVIGLDLSGYRFGSARLAQSGLLTLFTLFALIGCYHLVLAIMARIIRSRRRMPTVNAPGRRATISRTEFIEQLGQSLRLFFIVIGVWLFSSYWGLNESIFHILSGYTLYGTTTTSGSVEFVTMADLLRFLIGFILLVWGIKHLPKFFELVIFSRVKWDSGLRYAIVTISRYLLSLLGAIVAFSSLKLDLAKVGWLVAAISVGIGFGLQEIVANFVSGIILLLERPIRVGDFITVGAAMGKVTQINIRSTTILTPDLQELLIPNRDLITKEVTNWTLGNATVRLVVPIGAAYHSNVDQVMNLLLSIAQEQVEVLRDPPPEVLFMAHGINSLDFELRVFLASPSLRMPMLSRLNQMINKKFREYQIEIPFPQQELHVRSGSLPVNLLPVEDEIQNNKS